VDRVGDFAVCAMTRVLLACCLHVVASARSFPCPPAQPDLPWPSTADEVHPGHISAVMAMGDSMTAAFAAGWVLDQGASFLAGHADGDTRELPLEYRGWSFSGGEGADEHWTIPFFLKQYNASVYGFSTGVHIPETPGTGYYDSKHSSLNVALSKATSLGLNQQVDELLRRTQNLTGFQERWKLLTILIGANDMCDGMVTGFDACDGNVTQREALADRYERNLRDALTRLVNGFQNTIVQVVSLFQLASVPQARHGHPWCSLRKTLIDECNCIDRSASGTGNVSDVQLARLSATVSEFNERIRSVALDFSSPRPDFAVVEATAVREDSVPNFSFLSDLDCFHPSAEAHQILATYLWNGLFSDDRAPRPLDAADGPFCPTPKTVLYTASKTTPSKSTTV